MPAFELVADPPPTSGLPDNSHRMAHVVHARADAKHAIRRQSCRA